MVHFDVLAQMCCVVICVCLSHQTCCLVVLLCLHLRTYVSDAIRIYVRFLLGSTTDVRSTATTLLDRGGDVVVVNVQVEDELLALNHVPLQGLAFEEIVDVVLSLPVGKSSVWKIARRSIPSCLPPRVKESTHPSILHHTHLFDSICRTLRMNNCDHDTALRDCCGASQVSSSFALRGII
jgi:hypothetical protein